MIPKGYQPPTLTVDNVVFQLKANKLLILLGIVTSDPHRGAWALPGGFCTSGESTRQAMDRVLETKAGINLKDIKLAEQLYTFDAPVLDERGHAVSVTYLNLGRNIEPNQKDGEPMSTFFDISQLPPLAYDQTPIAGYALKRLRSKITYTNAVFALLPELFTLRMLQDAYETILDRKLDKHNFRKKFLSYGILVPTEEWSKQGAYRPARYYTFEAQRLENLNRDFET